MRNWVILGCLAFFLGACESTSERDITSPARSLDDGWAVPEWAIDAGMYEVNIRQFTPEGTFTALHSHLPRLKDMGIEILWLMPISPISETRRKGTLGSYYSVTDFRAINPEYGNHDDFRDLVDAIHQHDMKVIIDWVPHHTGWDHPWIEAHPEYYSKDEEGNIVDPINEATGETWGWTDVAELDLTNLEMRTKIAEDMIFWVRDYDIDGFRVDHAHRVPLDYWLEVLPKVNQVKSDLFWLAEGADAWLKNRAGFHATYSWEFHHAMNAVAQGEENVNLFDYLLWHDANEVSRGFHIYFTSNHDENTWAGTVFDRMGDAHKAMAVLSATLDGMPLIYSGQEEPLRKRLEFFEKDPIDWQHFEYAPFYKALLDLKKDNQALWNGEAGGKPMRANVSDDVYAFTRTKNDDVILAILNLSASTKISDIHADIGQVTELFTGKSHNFQNTTSVELKPWAYQVWVRKS